MQQNDPFLGKAGRKVVSKAQEDSLGYSSRGYKSKVSRPVILKKILFWSITKAFKLSVTKTYPPRSHNFFLIQIQAHDVSVNLAAHRSRVIGVHPTMFHHMIRVGSSDFYPVVKGIMGFMETQDVAKRRRLVRASRVSGMKNSAFKLDDVLSSKSPDGLR